MQTINLQSAVRTILSAYAQGKLQAQAAPKSEVCEYLHQPSGSKCAIGVCLSDETLATIRDTVWSDGMWANRASLLRLVTEGVIAFESDRDHALLGKLQSLHDDWATAMSDTLREHYHALFRGALDMLAIVARYDSGIIES